MTQTSTTSTGDPTLPGIALVDSELNESLRTALSAKPEGYEPRTHHFEEGGEPTYVNRLIRETSPYLLQHAHNPVNWFAWGDEAFEKARRENKPVLLSVGYSTCHWCHVMERESFENVEIAAFINEHFVAIKVDREERPDIDAIYMRAVQMLTGRGGWPMTVAMTPDRKPFFGGTYFPPTDGARGARQGFLSILRELSDAYRERRDEVVGEAENLTRRIQASSEPARPGNVPGASALSTAATRFQRSYEPTYGGFGRAPKFPQPARLLMLLRYARRANSPDHGAMVERTLEKMAAGGMFDQLGGGFHRYSVDNRWLVPHFEKMLYDNAQLVVAYLEGAQAFARPDFLEVAETVLDYVAREMTAPLGGFYSATDADSDTPSGHQEEGWFFTWTPEEVSALVDEEASRRFNAYYQVTPGGNFEGRSILHTPRPMALVAPELGVTEAELSQSLAASRPVLFESRLTRPPPLRDDKVLASWNGLMISAFAKGAEQILGDHGYQARAEAAANFVLGTMRDEEGCLYRSALGNEPRHRGYLEDYSFVIQGLLDLFESSSEPRWLREARALSALQDEHYWDEENGGYFTTADDHESLLVRERAYYDGAVPSGNSVAALNLLRLYEFTGQEAYRERAEALFQAFSQELSASGHAVPRMLSALDYYLDVPLQVVIVRGSSLEPLLEVVRNTFLPNRIFLVVDEQQAATMTDEVPLLEGKVAIGGRATAYVCERGRCELPTSSPAILTQQLRQVHPLEP